MLGWSPYIKNAHSIPVGRYARGVTLITEDREPKFLAWIAPRRDQYAVLPVLGSAFDRLKKFSMGSNLNGGRRAMVPRPYMSALLPDVEPFV